jgi:hypothetical protein
MKKMMMETSSKTSPRQLAFESVLHSPMERRLALEQMTYRKPISIIKQFFEFFMLIRPQEPIRIIPNYPMGWYAQVASEDKVWTVECNKGEIKLIKVADLVGHASNGNFIVSAEEKLEMWNEYQQPCNYSGINDNTMFCVDFCNEEYDSFRCICCPWIERSNFDD